MEEESEGEREGERDGWGVEGGKNIKIIHPHDLVDQVRACH